MSGTSVACSDVDECDTGTDNCDINAVCLNTRAGFTRELNDGHSGKGDFCNDIHECLDSVCDSNAAFANNDGSYACVCNNGYTDDGITVSDTGDRNYDINAVCVNTPGAYTCDCLVES